MYQSPTTHYNHYPKLDIDVFRQIFTLFDDDGNDRVDFNEFVEFVEKVHVQHAPQLNEARNIPRPKLIHVLHGVMLC